MPVIAYVLAALIGAVIMPLLTVLAGSADILLVLASAIIGANMAPLGAALVVHIAGELDGREGSFSIDKIL